MNWTHAFLDLFRRSRLGYYADFAVTPPVTLLLLWLTVEGSWAWAAWFALGLLLWTLYEYLAHRFVSHLVPLLRDAHWLHHMNQKAYIAVPPWATLLFYAFFLWLFGLTSNALALGFSVGYIAYSALHTVFHYARVRPGDLLWPLKWHHVLHHRWHVYNYGVTTTLWDRVFGTRVR